MEAVEKKVELLEKVEGPMTDRVGEIVQKETGEERERRIREWNVVIRGMDDVTLREENDEDEKEEEQGAVGGINPPSGEQQMDQQMMTERKVEYLESGLELPKINITGIRKLRNKDIYTTKIDTFVCPPHISETVAVRIMKLAHRSRIASTTKKIISKQILLSILSILFETI